MDTFSQFPHVAVGQKLKRHCKAIILQFKGFLIKKKRKKPEENILPIQK